MKVRLWPAAVVILAAGLIPSAAAAEQPACDATLLGIRFEAAVLPQGFAWQDLTFGLYGWSGDIVVVDPTVEYPPSITLGAWCSSDPALMLRRLMEISDALSISETVSMADIGDGSLAVKDERGVLTVWWTDGPLVGSVRPWGVRVETFPLEDLEAIANALSVVMGATP